MKKNSKIHKALNIVFTAFIFLTLIITLSSCKITNKSKNRAFKDYYIMVGGDTVQGYPYNIRSIGQLHYKFNSIILYHKTMLDGMTKEDWEPYYIYAQTEDVSNWYIKVNDKKFTYAYIYKNNQYMKATDITNFSIKDICYIVKNE